MPDEPVIAASPESTSFSANSSSSFNKSDLAQERVTRLEFQEQVSAEEEGF